MNVNEFINLVRETSKNIPDAVTSVVLKEAYELGREYEAEHPRPYDTLENASYDQVEEVSAWLLPLTEVTEEVYTGLAGTDANFAWIEAQIVRGANGEESEHEHVPSGFDQRVNRYRGHCIVCGGQVQARAGKLWRSGHRWRVAHLACIGNDGDPGVVEIRTSGGTFYRNARGRCEDAPCCGCCTI